MLVPVGAGCYRLADWCGPSQLAALANQHQREASPVATSLPCPPWCERPAGHPLDAAHVADPCQAIPDSEDGPPWRVHRRRFSDRPSCAAVELRERAADPGGPSDLGADPDALTVVVHGPAGPWHLTGDGARRLASQLLDAADLYDTERDHITATTKETRR